MPRRPAPRDAVIVRDTARTLHKFLVICLHFGGAAVYWDLFRSKLLPRGQQKNIGTFERVEITLAGGVSLKQKEVV